ncbi:uncharacterized protein LOC18428213 [Amborella trichopoda]|uniref:O-fucosyltransferase family protein n=1 Tax=Amborella trichopoda TaxID=13333 RepID=W1NX06_AMBTC|nr:uncharacterized protein LOC18428213 [Amborella trichopoda]ERN00168.1 hypothetical protein AMTR_s00111p00065220 [Amborella trichopoda]|eukprot:XP_006837314.1 uncharacterized protein LOC18428213 [Amborella trichopoda]
MNSFLNPNKKPKRNSNTKPIFNPLSCLFLFLSIISLFFILLSPSSITRFTFSLKNSPPQCNPKSTAKTLEFLPKGEKYLWYSPHSGFSNQVSELRNAFLIGSLLNRTVIIPPILDHHAVALGSCPKFRVSSPYEIRVSVWDHIVHLMQNSRYVSISDVLDLSSLKHSVKMIDFRVFASLWCGISMDEACSGSLCCGLSQFTSQWGDLKQCGSLLSGLKYNSDCVYGVTEDCRTTVWTLQPNTDGSLDSFQPDESLRKKKNISYIRRRRDLFKAFGPGSKAHVAKVLSFGSLFSAPYNGSQLYIDAHDAPADAYIQPLLGKIEFLPFVAEILSAGKEFVEKKIRVPFLCAQLRLLDGQFKNHWKATFSALREKIQSLQAQLEGSDKLMNIFIMSDLPPSNWSGTYLGKLASDPNSFKIYTLKESDELVSKVAEKLMAREHGIRSGYYPREIVSMDKRKQCVSSRVLPEVLMYVEETVCSCASLGFVGTSGSTIAESIELMRKNNVCLDSNNS